MHRKTEYRVVEVDEHGDGQDCEYFARLADARAAYDAMPGHAWLEKRIWQLDGDGAYETVEGFEDVTIAEK